MDITLKNIAKKFDKNWVLWDVNIQFKSGGKYALLGVNGSGKSTLLKIISGQTQANKGEILYTNLEVEDIFQHLSYAAPYLDVIEELSFEELLRFTAKFKPFLKEYPIERILGLFNFEKNKWIKDYSSGMKQRVKLCLALFADVDLVLLDEPTNNLDEEGILWYLEMIKLLSKNRTVIIASNDEREYSFCENIIEITSFKK